MSESPEAISRPVRHPSRVRAARAALLDENARRLLSPVRDVFCEPTRTQLVRALGTGPLTVNDLAAVIGRSKSSTSQHLRVLRSDGIVAARREGRVVYYSLRPSPPTRAALQALEAVAAVAAA